MESGACPSPQSNDARAKGDGAMRRVERWPTREERERMRAQIAAAGGVSAWIRSAKPDPEQVRVQQRRMNALADKCGMARPYPEVDEPDAQK
jgi:hypothetical protein